MFGVAERGEEAAKVEHYRGVIRRFNIERVAQLEAELASEKEMNAILTNELFDRYG